MILSANTLFDKRYYLLEMKGRGSYGEVWRARDQRLDIDVAVKVYVALDSRGFEEFKSEYMAAFGLNHPNLLHAYYYDICEDRPYLVMPYCPNSSVDLMGNMDETILWRFIHDVSSGLEYLHRMGVVHHDIKPDNILMDEYGNFLITDFGISIKFRSTLRINSQREAKSKIAGGSVPYMAPEMFDSDPEAVNASDIWALGVTMYELITGDLPFFGQGGALERMGAMVPEIHSDHSDDLKKVVQWCLALNPWDRPMAKQLVKISQAVLDGEKVKIWNNKSAEEEARKKAEEEARRKAEEEARKKAEEEARRKAEEEARKKAEEEERRKAEEEARKKAEEEARRKAEEEARKKAEEEARRKAEEEARKKAEEEARRKAEEEARKKAEEEAKRKAKEEARRKAEEEANRKAEEKARIKAEEEARRKAEEEARRKAKEEARRKAEEEANRKAEEKARIKAEEEVRKKAEEEARRKAKEEARRKAEEEAIRKAEEKTRIKAEEEARKKAEEEARKAEKARKAKEEKTGIVKDNGSEENKKKKGLIAAGIIATILIIGFSTYYFSSQNQKDGIGDPEPIVEVPKTDTTPEVIIDVNVNNAKQMLLEENTAEQGIQMLTSLADSGDYEATFLLSRVYFDPLQCGSKGMDFYREEWKTMRENCGFKGDNNMAHQYLMDAYMLKGEDNDDYAMFYELGCDFLYKRGTGSDWKKARWCFERVAALATDNIEAAPYLDAIKEKLEATSYLKPLQP